MTYNEEDKGHYISRLSKMSDSYGNPYLTGLMDYYNKNSLREITLAEAKAYYEKKQNRRARK